MRVFLSIPCRLVGSIPKVNVLFLLLLGQLFAVGVKVFRVFYLLSDQSSFQTYVERNVDLLGTQPLFIKVPRAIWKINFLSIESNKS